MISFKTVQSLILLLAVCAAGALQAQTPQLLYYRFNEGTGTTTQNAASTGLGSASPSFINTAGAPSAPGWVSPGRLGAFSENAGNFVFLPSAANAAAALSGPAWTIEFWIRGARSGAAQVVCSTGNQWFCIGFSNAGNSRIQVQNQGYYQCESTVDVLDNTWHHVAYVYNGTGTLSLYFDGVFNRSQGGCNPAVTGSNFTIGSWDAALAKWPLNTDLDEFRFWNVARTQAEIQSCMNAELGVTSAPEIRVTRGPVPVAFGGADNVGTGFSAGASRAITYTIGNTGGSNLTLTNPASIGALTNCTVAITTAPAGNVAPAATTSTTLTITPIATGAFNFTYSMANNDPVGAHNPYSFTVDGIASSSITMDVARGASPVPDGTTDAAGSGFQGQTATALTYTIVSSGTGDLVLTNPASITGQSNCSVTITTAPGSPIVPTGSSNTVLSVIPTTGGAFSFNYSIGNNDPGSGKNPYNFTVTGTAAASPISNMGVWRNATLIPDGGADNTGGVFTAGQGAALVYAINNTGTLNLMLTNPPVISAMVNCSASVSTNPTTPVVPAGSSNAFLIVTATVPGAFSFVYTQYSNDWAKYPYNFTMNGTASSMPVSDMGVTRAATAIADGTTDNVGSAFTVGIGSTLTYNIGNAGNGNLTLTNPAAISGIANCSVAITSNPATPVAPAGSTTTVLTVTPIAAGAFSFDYSIGNNDPGAGKNPYDWTVSGTASVTAAPEMDATRGAAPVSVASTDNVGSGFTAGAAATLTYTLTNSGTAALTLSNPASIGSLSNCAVAITSSPPASIGAGASADTILSVTATAAGAFSFTYSIGNNDGNENPYTWIVSGSAVALSPEMDVARGATAIADGGSDLSGSVQTGTAQTASYTISNSGTAALNLTGAISLVTVTPGANVTLVSVTTLPATPIAVAGNTTCVVTYTVVGAGAFDFSISIANDDSNENPYDWTVLGSGLLVAPEMNVMRGTSQIVSSGGDSISFAAPGTPVLLTYAISNTGNATLTLSTPLTLLAGVNCTASVTSQPSSAVAAAGSTTLVISVTPSTAGAFSFGVTIDNDDPNENPYTWTTSGTATIGGVGQSGGGNGGAGGCAAGDTSWLLLGLLFALPGIRYLRRRQG